MIYIKTCSSSFNKLMETNKISIIKDVNYKLLLNGSTSLEFTTNDLKYVISKSIIEKYKYDLDQYLIQEKLKPIELIKLIDIVISFKSKLYTDAKKYKQKNNIQMYPEPSYLRRLKFVYLTIKEII